MYDLSKRFTLYPLVYLTLHPLEDVTLHPLADFTPYPLADYTLNPRQILHSTQPDCTLHPLTEFPIHPLADVTLDPFQTFSFQQQLDFRGKQSPTLKIQGYRLFRPLYIARYTSFPLSLQHSLLPPSPYITPSVPPSQVLSIHN